MSQFPTELDVLSDLHGSRDSVLARRISELNDAMRAVQGYLVGGSNMVISGVQVISGASGTLETEEGETVVVLAKGDWMKA